MDGCFWFVAMSRADPIRSLYIYIDIYPRMAHYAQPISAQGSPQGPREAHKSPWGPTRAQGKGPRSPQGRRGAHKCLGHESPGWPGVAHKGLANKGPGQPTRACHENPGGPTRACPTRAQGGPQGPGT